jgi:hypothetical protein
MKVLLKTITITKPIFAIYIGWCLVSLIFFYLGLLIPGNELIIQLLEPVTITFFIFLASLVTMFFIIHIEKHIKENTSLRIILLLMTFLFFIGNYYFTILTGNKSNILNCLSTANLIFFACIIGNWMTIPVKRPAEIVPLCIVVAFADLFSVFAGPTKHLVKNISAYYQSGMMGTPPFIDYLLIKITLPGIEVLMPIFGISDWIIIAFLSAAAYKFNLNDNLIGKGIGDTKISFSFCFFPIASAGLILSIVIARVAGVFIPALPFVVLLFLGLMMAKYSEMRKLTKVELVPMLLIPGIMIVLMIIKHN